MKPETLMQNWKTAVALAAITMLAALPSACGGKSDGKATAPATPAKPKAVAATPTTANPTTATPAAPAQPAAAQPGGAAAPGTPPTAGPKPPGMPPGMPAPKLASAKDMEMAMKEFEGITAAMCACKDEACLKNNQGALAAFMQKTRNIGRPNPNDPSTPKLRERLQVAGKKMQECIAKIAPKGLGPMMPPPGAPGRPGAPGGHGAHGGKGMPPMPPAGNMPIAKVADLEKAAKEFEGLVGELCGCKDMECINGFRPKMTGFMQRSAMMGRPDEKDPASAKVLEKLKGLAGKMQKCMMKMAPPGMPMPPGAKGPGGAPPAGAPKAPAAGAPKAPAPKTSAPAKPATK